ncbi:MAG: DUF2666 family protein [Candidatus Diapherotrites archaeon]|nr:DUF2666 family protein [Candidatus Diapherotrites archaeon]
MDDQIQFVGKYREWIAIKKMEITPESKPTEVALFLASLSETLERKTEDFLRGALDFTELDKEIEKLVPGPLKSEEEFAAVLKGLKSPKISKIINESIGKLGLNTIVKTEKAMADALKEFGKIYTTRKALERAGLALEYGKVAKLTRKV